MKIRRFYGSNIRSALRQVTEEFGTDAAILSNKKVAGGVEVIAALEYDESLVAPTPELSRSHKLAELPQVDEAESAKPAARNVDVALHAMAQTGQRDENSSDFAALLNSSGESTNNGENTKVMAHTKVSPEPIEWSLDPSLQAMKEELGLMRSMMSEQLKGIGWHQFAEQNPLSAMILRRLSKIGLDSEFLNALLPRVTQQNDAECAWQQVLAIFAKAIPVSGADLLENGGIYAFMGPAGVGKTTTIAKLAARYVIKHGADSVALITTDNYRISAQDQLATFGRILQLPSAKVTDNQSLAMLLKKYADKKLVLIDTAGMSPSDQHLVTQLEHIQSCGNKIHKFLLMSAASQGAVLEQSLNLFNAYQPDSVIVTKLDEAASLGALLSVVTRAYIPIAYTTDGQRIPEDIRVARSHHLVSKAVWLASKYAKMTDDWDLAQTISPAKSA